MKKYEPIRRRKVWSGLHRKWVWATPHVYLCPSCLENWGNTNDPTAEHRGERLCAACKGVDE